MPRVKVDLNTCTGCGICARVCPVTVFDIDDRKAIASRVATCMACELCVVECPWRSISVERLAAPDASLAGLAATPPAAPLGTAAASGAPVSFAVGIEALPGVRPVSAAPPAAQTSPAPAAYSPGIIVPQSGLIEGPSPERAQITKNVPQVPQGSSGALPFLPVPDSFPYIIVKKGSPESGVE